MCGILGIIAPRGSPVTLTDPQIAHMRDLMAHRGPDGVGLVRDGCMVFAHRRLAVLDRSPGGAQPFRSADGRFSLVYNGEIYNDAELRKELSGLGERFSTTCDTETLFAALRHWGTEALHKVRGMFAFGFFDSRTCTLLLARDPLGIKPLYWWRGTSQGRSQFVFASEVAPILAHPDCPARPDWGAVSAYLTTARITTGERTLFEGIRTLEAGHLLRLDTREPELVPQVQRWWQPGRQENDRGPADARAVISDSVRRHLRADVPVCSLLSGGLDSSIIAAIAAPLHGSLQSFCAFEAGRTAGDGRADDADAARLVAAAVGTRHAEAVVSPETFDANWRTIVDSTAFPLATPNEIAILEVARTLKRSGCTVTLSGEGADEIFGGYDRTLDPAAAFEGLVEADGIDRGSPEYAAFAARHAIACAHWMPPADKGALLRPSIRKLANDDELLWDSARSEFRAAAACPFDHPLRVHLRVLASGNLGKLLRRLDSSTMLTSVEGRTPFADSSVAAWAESVPMNELFVASLSDPPLPPTQRTKRILRQTFAADLPALAVERPKASFPLPFDAALRRMIDHERASPFLADVLEPLARDSLTDLNSPLPHWAWPAVNLALWGRRFV